MTDFLSLLIFLFAILRGLNYQPKSKLLLFFLSKDYFLYFIFFMYSVFFVFDFLNMHD